MMINSSSSSSSPSSISSSLSWWKVASCVFVALWSVALTTKLGKQAGWAIIRPVVTTVFFTTDTTQLSPSKGIKVIGAGPGRTGTVSLSTALSWMGYRTYHMTDCLIHRHADLWQHAFDTGDVQPILQAIVDLGYDAIVDDPGSSFVPHFAHHFPNAKIILTHRGNQSTQWIQSLGKLASLHDEMNKPPFCLVPYMRRHFHMADGIFEARGCSLYDVVPYGDPNGTCDAFYQHHMNDIKQRFGNNTDRFLEFHVSEGWEPLVNFLDWQPTSTAINDGATIFPPFPNSNGSDEVARLILASRALVWLFYAVTFMLFVRVVKWIFVRPAVGRVQAPPSRAVSQDIRKNN